MTDLFHQPGFLGTSANWAADMTLLIMLLIALIFSIGAWMAVRGKYAVHRLLQTTAVILNLILVSWMMILPYRDFVAPGLPQRINERFYFVTTLHALLGFSALVLGIFVTLRGNGLMIKPLRFNNYKLFMRISYGLYMLATLVGIWVYFTWFVNNPNPPVY
ncbi:MAG: hypothetical protein GWP61_14990 [Chloroflexi bacterium]|jgi:uncharacterized membrane protein YozB (DUF420 family)|nr:hypothetical protein [Chloroflexota bacterium]